MTATQKRILDNLRTYAGQRISYDTLSALVGCERRSVVTAVRHLEENKLIMKKRGRGTLANSYLIVVQF